MQQINADRLTQVNNTTPPIHIHTWNIPTNAFAKRFHNSHCLLPLSLSLQLANQYWSPNATAPHLAFDAAVIEDIYAHEIRQSRFSGRRIMMLEFSQYLENYLWPNYAPASATPAHIMSIVIMHNEKVRERVDAWAVFRQRPAEFAHFFRQVLEACLPDDDDADAAASDAPASLGEQTALVLFLNHCFNSMEVELCREQAKRLVSLAMWSCLQPARREQELRAVPEWRRFWRKLQKRDRTDAPEQRERVEWERHFLQRLMVRFMRVLETVPERGAFVPETVRYCERFVELLIDLEALLPTRRFFNTVMDDCHVVVRCSLAPLVRRDEGKLFAQVSVEPHHRRPSAPRSESTTVAFRFVATQFR